MECPPSWGIYRTVRWIWMMSDHKWRSQMCPSTWRGSPKLASSTDCWEMPLHQKVWREELCCFGIACHLSIVLTRNARSSQCNSCVFCPVLYPDDMMEAGVVDDGVPLKKQKVLERCKFWPVCKSGDECLYHHPTTQCKWEFDFSLQPFVHTTSADLKINVFSFP